MHSKPHSEQVEVSVFGPGRGESIVVHIGNDKWIIIDSCYDKTLGEPSALAYLKSIDVNLKKDVVLIISTHWHDDHIQGLSACVKECENAEFCCSMAFGNEVFYKMIKSYDADKVTSSGSGTSEISAVFDLLSDHQRSPTKAVENKILYKDSSSALKCEVLALSPSDKQVDEFFFELQGIQIKVNENRRRVPSHSPNHSCVVILIQVGDRSILLGADHEETQDPSTGWTRIVNSTIRPQAKSSVYKIAHHGSSNADVEAVWEEMLITNPYVVLTPFRNSKLPRAEMVTKISDRTETAYSTAKVSNVNATIKREKVVDRMIKETVGKIKVEPNAGQVRIRSVVGDDSNNWETELFSGACHLSEVSYT